MKDFDIYLHRRLTECDVLVYSVPFRDGLTVIGRTVLEGCLKSYLLQKFVAAQTGSELEAHIDKMLALVCERLNAATELNASAGMVSQDLVRAGAGIELNQAPVKLLAAAANRAYGALELAAEPVLLHSAKKVGTVEAMLDMAVRVDGTQNRSFESFVSDAAPEALVLSSLKRSMEGFNGSAAVQAELEKLCCRFYQAGETALELAANVLEIGMCHANRAEAGMAVTAEAREWAVKFEQAQSALGVMTELAQYARLILGAVRSETGILAEAGSSLRRLRKLSEMDPNALMAFDSVSVVAMDYTVLED